MNLGYIDYINCYPFYHHMFEIEPLDGVRVVPGYPSELNRMMEKGELDMNPISAATYADLEDEVVLLPDFCLSSVGYVHSVILSSNIPIEELHGKKVGLTSASKTSVILVVRKGGGRNRISAHGRHNPNSPEMGMASPDCPAWMRDARIAVPGRYTTAYLLLQLWQGGRVNAEFVRFDEILPGVASGRYDAGLVIHEGRFVYQNCDCRMIVDLGQWWEAETGLPLPLGCIALRRDMSRHREAVEALLRQSVDHARSNPRAGIAFIKRHAQELDEKVISAHISLYVNEFTLSLGETGVRAIETLEERARCLGIL
jgi:predicted solute-binding protein